MCAIQRHLRTRPDLADVCLVDINRPKQGVPQDNSDVGRPHEVPDSARSWNVKKQAGVLTIEDETMPWEKGIFSAETAKQLLHTVFLLCVETFLPLP